MKIEEKVIGTSVIRENLIISVSKDRDKFNSVFQLLKSNRFNKGSVIVYCQYKYETEKLALFLSNNSISAYPFHSGLPKEQKEKNQ